MKAMCSTLYRRIGRQQNWTPRGFHSTSAMKSMSSPLCQRICRKPNCPRRQRIPRRVHYRSINALEVMSSTLCGRLGRQWKFALVARRDADARRNASDQGIGMTREGSGFSAGLRSVEPSIRVVPRRSGSSIGGRALRAVAACFVAALIGIGGSSVWLSNGDEAMEMVRTWTPSLGWLSLISMMKSPPASAPAAATTSPELAHQLEAMPRDLAVVKRSVEQLTEKQEQMARNIATLRSAEHDIKKKTSSPHVQSRVKLTPWPETRPTTIAGWTLRGVTNGTAVLEGPSGVWRAMQGDTVPGVGRVESMVRWGD